MRNRIWSARGRPRGNHLPRPDARALQYLIQLSMKHRIDPTEFFNAFVHAWQNGKANCRGITIQPRIRKDNRGIFLVTKGNTVLAQFSISEEILQVPNPLDRFDFLRQTIRDISTTRDRQTKNVGTVNIEDLKAGMKGVSLNAKVTEISRPKLVLTRLNEYALFANATLSDKNDTIKVPLWNKRIESVSVNDRVQIDNARVTVFRGEKQLRIGRNGTLRVVEGPLSHAA